MDKAEQQRKIAILGGGVGAITAAFALTSTAQLRADYEVTVYACGWRLGGKGASGRNAAMGQRIEEHGLHIWFGFYDNAFRLMRQCYEELGRQPNQPLATLEAAFRPNSEIVLFDQQDGTWLPWVHTTPRNPFPVGEDHEMPTFWEIVGVTIQWLRDLWHKLDPDDAPPPPAPASASLHFPGWIRDLAGDLDAELHKMTHEGEALFHLVERLAEVAARYDHPEREEHHRSILCSLLALIRRWAWNRVKDRVTTDAPARWWFTALDVGLTGLSGVLADGLLERGFTVVDDEELSAWLRRHGAMPVTVADSFADCCPLLRAVYDMAFAFVGGDTTCPNVAAGTAVHNMLKLTFAYKGALYWKMQAGMGDTVFMPYYEVLSRRGVRFEFFRWVDQLRLSGDSSRIAEIEMVPQVELVNGTYDPRFPVEELPCWPNQPLWSQIVDGDNLASQHPAFESGPGPLGLPPLVLRDGVDFDDVILGISVGGLATICAELANDPLNPKFGAMLQHTPSVATQAFQVWMEPPLADLGWVGSPGSISGSYVEPVDTYCDMSHLLPREAWPATASPSSVGYFCGVMTDVAGETQAAADARAHDNALGYLRNDVAAIWPNGLGPDHRGVAWPLLFDPFNGQGQDRFERQYWRANVAGTERYVLSPAGDIRHRLAADESGYANLWLAGDWTRNALSVGCVEAATMSGLEAARALSGVPIVISGEDHQWLLPKAARR